MHTIFATIMVKKVNVQTIHHMDGNDITSKLSFILCIIIVNIACVLNSIKIIEGQPGAGDHHGISTCRCMCIYGIYVMSM
jgi:hypothetical protein